MNRYQFPEGTPDRILQSPDASKVLVLSYDLQEALALPKFAGERHPRQTGIDAVITEARQSGLSESMVDAVGYVAVSLPTQERIQ